MTTMSNKNTEAAKAYADSQFKKPRNKLGKTAARVWQRLADAFDMGRSSAHPPVEVPTAALAVPADELVDGVMG